MARKRPFSPRRDGVTGRDVKRLEEKWNFLQDRFGGQKALADAFVNPKTGKPVNARTLRKWWSGERALPDYVTRTINELYKSVKREDDLRRRREDRRRKVASIKNKLQIYPFDGWWSAFENETMKYYDDMETMDPTLETLLGDITDIDPESVLIFDQIVPGWISPVFGKHPISDLCRSDLILYGYRVFVNDSYTRIYPIQHRPPNPMWNYEKKRYTRIEDYPKVLQLIMDAWENLAAAEYGIPVLVGFAKDPEQIE